jgi:hypothetical protein
MSLPNKSTFVALNSIQSPSTERIGYNCRMEGLQIKSGATMIAVSGDWIRVHMLITYSTTRSERFRSCLVDRYEAETQRATCMNGAQASPVAGAEPCEVMPQVSYRASAEAVLHEIRKVAGHRQSAKQLLRLQ